MKGGLGVIFLKHCCIYRSSQKRYILPPVSQFPLPRFQLAPDGWSNAIRSNYNSSATSPQSAPRLRTGTHSSDRKVRPNSVRLHPFTHPSFHPFILSLVFIRPVLPPHQPAHVLPLSTCKVRYYLTTSLFPFLSVLVSKAGI